MKKIIWGFILLQFTLLMDPVDSKTGLPIPRFVSLRSSQINVRVGPGRHYPIEWVFVKATYPVEIIAEFDNWRKIRDVEGSEGWVHQTMLSGNRYVLIHPTVTLIRSKPNNDAQILAKASEGVIGKLLSNQGLWCRIQVGSVKGWVPKASIWGVYSENNDNS